MISSDFKTILTGSSLCTFGRVMYKTKTLVKFVDNCKSLCSLFLLRSRITFEPFLRDFKTIMMGSSFLGLRSSVFVLYPPEPQQLNAHHSSDQLKAWSDILSGALSGSSSVFPMLSQVRVILLLP